MSVASEELVPTLSPENRRSLFAEEESEDIPAHFAK